MFGTPPVADRFLARDVRHASKRGPARNCRTSPYPSGMPLYALPADATPMLQSRGRSTLKVNRLRGAVHAPGPWFGSGRFIAAAVGRSR